MINLTKHSVNGKISVKSLVKTFDEYQAKEKELANKMFHLRGVFPRPEEYIELRNEMAQVKTTLSDLRNCLKIYCRYGNINGKEVINDCEFTPPDDWKKAEREKRSLQLRFFCPFFSFPSLLFSPKRFEQWQRFGEKLFFRKWTLKQTREPGNRKFLVLLSIN